MVETMHICPNCMSPIAFGTFNKIVDVGAPSLNKKCDVCGKTGMTAACKVDIGDRDAKYAVKDE